MNKLKTIIQYECTISFKYIWFFYAIEYAIMALIYAIITIIIGSAENIGISCFEMNTFIYVGMLGVLGFKEDFKMLIQNGFTRKYIFLATLSLFAFISGIMALIDTVVGNVLHYALPHYSTIFGIIYGYKNIFTNWIWLFLVYTLVCSLLYLIVLLINRVGKNLSIYISIIFGGCVLLVVALFRYVLSNETVNKIIELTTKAMGFMSDGTINYMFPLLTLFLFVIVLGLCSYVIIRRTELK